MGASRCIWARRLPPVWRCRPISAKGWTTGDDPELEALLFQYGRYLLISCSRPGSLPANLQGLWNDSNDQAWSTAITMPTSMFR